MLELPALAWVTSEDTGWIGHRFGADVRKDMYSERSDVRVRVLLRMRVCVRVTVMMADR